VKDGPRQKIRQFIVDQFLFGEEGDPPLADTDSLLDNEVMDSTGALELVMFLEETFEITVEDEELVPANLDSVQRATELVLRKRREAGAPETES